MQLNSHPHKLEVRVVKGVRSLQALSALAYAAVPVFKMSSDIHSMQGLSCRVQGAEENLCRQASLGHRMVREHLLK